MPRDEPPRANGSPEVCSDPSRIVARPIGAADRGSAWLVRQSYAVARLSPARDALRSRIVLVDFWTYTCVNWLRTLPYLRAWHAKYADAGLTIVGVHTPEFSFEHDLRNVIERARDLGSLPVPSTTTSGFGTTSRTDTGQLSTWLMQRGGFATTTSVKANMP